VSDAPLGDVPPEEVPLNAAEVSSVRQGDMTLPAPRQVLDGEQVLRVNWLPGSDRLRGLCHCGRGRGVGPGGDVGVAARPP
jgi:hypothetical protein